MLFCVHKYHWDTEEEGARYLHLLIQLYGTYMHIKKIKIKHCGTYILENMTLDTLSKIPWGDDIQFQNNKLSQLCGRLTIVLPCVPMQHVLLPKIQFPKTPTKSMEQPQETKWNFQSKEEFHDYVSQFVMNYGIQRGFYDKQYKTYFLLYDTQVLELDIHKLRFSADICLDLDHGFFGPGCNDQYETWNEMYFEPWRTMKKWTLPLD